MLLSSVVMSVLFPNSLLTWLVQVLNSLQIASNCRTEPLKTAAYTKHDLLGLQRCIMMENKDALGGISVKVII